ncbi:hypothetical protein GF380_00020 [Candidatus Uhrbacteria bacterium]|nr:hypothetical protein [Candidatus Uhrbacteria bacterium]MBD3283811.1 hypothetical protein [Candidatus Uhrbacteria bacterium]
MMDPPYVCPRCDPGKGRHLWPINLYGQCLNPKCPSAIPCSICGTQLRIDGVCPKIGCAGQENLSVHFSRRSSEDFLFTHQTLRGNVRDCPKCRAVILEQLSICPLCKTPVEVPDPFDDEFPTRISTPPPELLQEAQQSEVTPTTAPPPDRPSHIRIRSDQQQIDEQLAQIDEAWS